MIGILNAYHSETPSAGNYQEEYSRLFYEFVQNIFPQEKDSVVEYKVAQGKFPKSANECSIWFITGSPKGVNDDLPWIKQLSKFTKKLHAKKKKLIGICFGHQMVAQALGGQVSKSLKGWGVGIRRFEIMNQQSWMTPADNKLFLIFSHQDQVDVLPTGAELLAGDEFCPKQMMQIGNHILTFQGHPEFTENFAKDRLNSRREQMPDDTYQTALKSFEGANDYKKMTTWIRNFVTEV